MRTKATAAPYEWPPELVAPGGTLVLSGYGLEVRVFRGLLRIGDGVGRHRREALVHRATGRLRRLVVLGHSGVVTLEAIRWLADVGAGFLQIDADGRVLAAFGPQGTDRPALRRAQARALDTPLGDDIAHGLIGEKILGQVETLKAVDDVAPIPDVAIESLRSAATALHVAIGRDEIRRAEAAAAAAYWSAWSAVPVRFARRDAERVPAHWRTVGGRTSPLTGGPRLAANPANAILNYLYALLEGEATIAAQLLGLDPGLGVLHADQDNRASLAADLMEPVRPLVDRWVLQILVDRPLALADLYETRQGVCRLTPSLAEELTETLPLWRKHTGRVAEGVAARLLGQARPNRPLPTPISGSNRARSRPSGPRARTDSAPRPRSCSWCGGPTEGSRATCGPDCEAAARAAQDRSAWLGAGARRLRELRAAGTEPVAAEARARMGERQRERQRQENEWNAAHPERPGPEVFRHEVLPAILSVSLGELARRTGLSASYLGLVRRGVEVPHPRWWPVLLERR